MQLSGIPCTQESLGSIPSSTKGRREEEKKEEREERRKRGKEEGRKLAISSRSAWGSEVLLLKKKNHRSDTLLFKRTRAGDMAQLVTNSAAKPDNLSSVPKNHMIESEILLPQDVLCPPHIHCGMHTYIYTQINCM